MKHITYTRHARMAMRDRDVTEADVRSILSNPQIKTVSKNDTLYRTGPISVIAHEYPNTLVVITVLLAVTYEWTNEDARQRRSAPHQFNPSTSPQHSQVSCIRKRDGWLVRFKDYTYRVHFTFDELSGQLHGLWYSTPAKKRVSRDKLDSFIEELRVTEQQFNS